MEALGTATLQVLRLTYAPGPPVVRRSAYAETVAEQLLPGMHARAQVLCPPFLQLSSL